MMVVMVMREWGLSPTESVKKKKVQRIFYSIHKSIALYICVPRNFIDSFIYHDAYRIPVSYEEVVVNAMQILAWKE